MDVARAQAFNHGLLAGRGPVARLCRRSVAAGRYDQAQRGCQILMAHPGHLGYLLADRRMLCFSSSFCTAFAPGGGGGGRGRGKSAGPIVSSYTVGPIGRWCRESRLLQVVSVV